MMRVLDVMMWRAWHNLKLVTKQALAAATSRRDYDAIVYPEEEWDNMLVLDGCRYDMMADRSPFDASVEKVYSNAAHTMQYLRRNFKGRDNTDIVYVSGTPQIALLDDLGFHAQIDVWADSWDDELRTLPADAVAEAVRDAADRFPHKRIVGHFMQPHYPFIGEEQLPVREHNPGYDPRWYAFLVKEALSPWEHLQEGHLTREEVETAYRSNLEYVLPFVTDLVPALEGKTVVTSDHGNVYGKRIGLSPFKVYGHGHFWSDREIAAVPWIEIEHGERTITRGEERLDSTEQAADEEAVKKKLADLGYV